MSNIRKKKPGFLHFLQGKSVPVRSILILMVAVVCIAIIFMMLFYHDNVVRSEQEIAVLYGKSADSYITSVREKLNSYFTTMGMVGLNQSVRQNIFRTDVTPSRMVDVSRSLSGRIDEMTFFLYRSGEVRQHNLYTYLPADGRYFFSLQEASRQPWYRDVKKRSPCWCYSYSNVTGSNLLTIASVINAFGSEQPSRSEDCYQTVTVDTSMLFSPGAASFPDKNAAVFVFDDAEGKLVYSSDLELKNTAADFYKWKKADLTDMEKIEATSYRGRNGASVFALLRPLSNLSATVLLLYEPVGTAGQERGEVVLLEIAGVILVVFLVVLLLFYWMFTRKLNGLIYKMDGFDELSFPAGGAMEGNDEIARIDRHLMEMQERIHLLIQQEYAAELDKMKAQNQALIACINPHFLYNTLNSISAMACMEGADGTVDMIDSLSVMFRYSSDITESFVRLSMELQNVRSYLHIQNIRYGNSFQYHVRVPGELQEAQVPKQILQPVVENVFKHAFHKTARPGKVLISARAEGRFLMISVLDNGAGIPPEMLEKLNRSFEGTLEGNEKDGSSHIGLWNVHHRIRLIYGDNCGLSLKSAQGHYTRVEIRLLREPPEYPPQNRKISPEPALRKDDCKNAENFDCRR